MKNFIKMPPSEDTSKAFESLVARSNNLFNGSLKENIFSYTSINVEAHQLTKQLSPVTLLGILQRIVV